MVKNTGELGIIILAAGKGTRMKSDTAKVLHKLASKSLINHVLETALKISRDNIYVVVGYQAEQVKNEVRSLCKINFAYQKKISGTGDAVKSAIPILDPNISNVLVLCGDVPLIKPQTLQALIEVHVKNSSEITVLAANMENPKGYGRILCDDEGNLLCIREEADASAEEKKITTVNTGVYCFNRNFLASALNEISPENKQKEYYLTDVVEIGKKWNQTMSVFTAQDSAQFIGVNSPDDLRKAYLILDS